MRNQSARTPLAVTVFLALLSFGVVQQKAISAAEAGISQSDDSRAKALLHPAERNSVEKGEKARVLLRPAAAEDKDKRPAPKKDLGKDIAAVLSQPPLNRAHWGVDVVDLDTGKALYSQNSDQLFLPASNAKLFTTAAALAIAGPDYRFHTTVEAEGKIDDNGRLLGDLVIFGRGDPNISGRVLPYLLKTQRMPPHTQILEDMADQVARNGLKIVDGDLVGDDTFYAFEPYAEGWAWDDLQWIDGAPVSALTFNDNVVFVNVLPGEHPGDKAVVTVEPETSYYELDNRVVTSSLGVPKRVGLHRDPGSKKIVLWG
ncbi:MAG TPA: D-alanyl-D-alanine carboxypeptidase/D-alanyl-D-alanine-endopeptidase, partial [Blattabacteriaceae bacterium]|nr:D-alanyl-D-alanine carboxypeptidase/D-alanyl-D-alanine-endopeptidase [Blattabacteriaceae bacterium]